MPLNMREVPKPQSMTRGANVPNSGGWQTRLAALLKNNNHMKISGKGATSFRTRAERSEKLYAIFRLLRDLDFKIEEPQNLKPKHIEALVKHWVKKEYSPATIENYMSHVRALSTWIGKPDLVKPLAEYAPDIKRVYAAQNDKSFEGNNIDFWDVWEKVQKMDRHVAMQLLFVKAFGARRKEAVMFKPLVADRGDHIELFAGTKGGRPRTVSVDSDFKRTVLDVLKNFVTRETFSAKGHIGHPDKDLAQNLKRYSYVLGACEITKKQLGVTGHGLRAEYVINKLASLGVVATIRGGDGKAATKLETEIAYLQAAEETGHSRKSVITAYSGPLRPPAVIATTELTTEQTVPVMPAVDGQGEDDVEAPDDHTNYPDPYDIGGKHYD